MLMYFVQFYQIFETNRKKGSVLAGEHRMVKDGDRMVKMRERKFNLLEINQASKPMSVLLKQNSSIFLRIHR